MRPVHVLLGLVGLLLIVTVEASSSVVYALHQNGFKLYARLLEAVPQLDHDAGAGTTILAPTDEALYAFLGEMGLTVQAALDRKLLISSLVYYHMVLAKQINAHHIIGDSKELSSSRELLVFSKDSRGVVTVKDVQANRANIIHPNLVAGKVVIQGIDRVLRDGRTFNTFEEAAEFHKEWASFLSAAEQAGLKCLFNSASGVTVFAPREFPLSLSPGLARSELAAVLEYHVVAGYKELPSGFRKGSGSPQETLLTGHTISVQISTTAITDPETRERQVVIHHMYVRPEAGPAAAVAAPNVFVGQSILHGVNGMLLPKGSQAAAATARRQAGPSAARKLAQGGRSGSNARAFYRYEQIRTARWEASNAIESASMGRSTAAEAVAVASDSAASVCCYGR